MSDSLKNHPTPSFDATIGKVISRTRLEAELKFLERDNARLKRQLKDMEEKLERQLKKTEEEREKKGENVSLGGPKPVKPRYLSG